MNSSKFSLSQNVNPSRVFILQKSELEKSLSPLYYSTLPKKLLHSKKLKEIAIVNPTREKPKFDDDDLVPYVGLPQTDEHSKSIIEVVFRPYKEVKGRSVIYPNELLFARIEPSVFNKKYILTNDLKGYDFAFTSTEFYVVKGKEVDNEYLLANFLSDYVYKQVEGKTTGSTGRRRLDTTVFAELIFPFPEDKSRRKVSQIITQYFAQKQQSEAEAEKLLSSIDDYLLNELGIKLPEPTENTLKYRMFIKTFKEISDGRIDPHFHQEKFKQLDIQLNNGKYPLSNLKKKSILITSGATPLSKGDSYTEDASIGVPFVRSGEIKDITFENCIYIKPEIHNTMLKSSQLKKGDLLIAIVGATIGEVGIYDHNREANINQAIALVRLNDEVLPVFAKDFYKSSIGSFILDRAKRPVARANINLDEIGILPIPVPPLDKQKEIAEHITGIRQQAQQLKDKTKEALKKASEEIEEILLN